MKVLVTGATGFVGSHICEELVNQGHEVVALDALTYAGRLDRLAHLSHKAITFVRHDFRDALSAQTLEAMGDVQYVIHNGACSHVARSFVEPRLFMESNILGTLNMLQAAVTLKAKKFIYVSTDEVFGPSTGETFTEDSPLLPTNPYSATKAAGEHLTYAFFRSFGLPVVVTRTMNMFGERQHPEKFVPMTIKKVLAGEMVYVHCNADGEMGSRHWVHASEQAKALVFLLEHGVAGESYNVSAGLRKTNLEILQLIEQILGMDADCQVCISDRPFHDLHYSIDDSKLKKIFNSGVKFDEAFRQTVLWTAQHQEFLKG